MRFLLPLRLSSRTPQLGARPTLTTHSSVTATTTQTRSKSAEVIGWRKVRSRRERGNTKQPVLDPPIPKPFAKDLHIPPYPLGPRQVYKQSNAGLYGTARIRFGNTVAPKYGNKSRRKWRPNVQKRRLWSEALGVRIQTRVTTRVLRTIDKCGGIDEYLLGEKAARIAELGPWGWKLRWRLMQSPAVQERFRKQREAFGLPPEGLLAGQLDMVDAAAVGNEEQLMAETQRVIDGEEIDLGIPEDEGFMVEEPGQAQKAKEA
jgi:large subunit ribosomal protein L28